MLVCAPTGAAAYNIAGHTCHAAFQLPLQKRKDDDYIPLSTEKLTAMKTALGDTKLIVTDEVSMVMMMMMMMIHSISSAPFICENHIQRRLAPQIVIINFTFAGKGVF